jgi:transposase
MASCPDDRAWVPLLAGMLQLPCKPREQKWAQGITFLNGIAWGRHHYQVRQPPPDHFFNGLARSPLNKRPRLPPVSIATAGVSGSTDGTAAPCTDGTDEALEILRGAGRLHLRQIEAGTPVGDVCRQLGVSEATFYAWKKKYAHWGVSELRRLR